MTLPAFAVDCHPAAPLLLSMPAAVDRYLLPAQCSAANLPAAVVDGTDEQTVPHSMHGQ